MKTISMDLRERILASYDKADATREQVAQRFRVSVGMVKKLLQQRRRRGDIRPQHFRSGRKPLLGQTHRQQLQALLAKKPDMTLAELRDQLSVKCTLQAVHYVLADMGLTYKKRLSERPSSGGRTSSVRVANGPASKQASIPRDWSSSTSPRRRPT